MILAANTMRSIGIVIAVLLALAWVAYLYGNLRRARPEVGSEIELAPNRKPYLDDEQLEGPKLEKALSWGLISLVIVGVGLPLYWLREPARQETEVAQFEGRAAGDNSELFGGEALYATTEEGGFNCAGCHGAQGVGGVTNFTLAEPVLDDSGQPVIDPETDAPQQTVRVVQWQVPALNTVLLRLDEEEVRRVIVHGRKGTPMPPWGLEGGGPMNEQMVNNVIAYLESIQLEPEEARQQSQELLDQTIASGDYDSDGAALFDLFCARCHTMGWTFGEPEEPGGGAFGPPLTNTVEQFPSVEDHEIFVSEGSEFEVQYGVRGIGSGRMPGFGRQLTEEQIAAIVEYERSLGEEPG